MSKYYGKYLVVERLAMGGVAELYLAMDKNASILERSVVIKKLLPQARVIVGHGQMTPKELDIVFHAFKSGEADILVATTIVENGIDIPNANTILIDRADR
jgi:transcription-repair coupling factor (superfamily II helicase)